jgi:hypothetical protein
MFGIDSKLYGPPTIHPCPAPDPTRPATAFSAQSIFPAAYIATYNALWTSVPTIAWGEQRSGRSAQQTPPPPGSRARARARWPDPCGSMW